MTFSPCLYFSGHFRLTCNKYQGTHSEFDAILFFYEANSSDAILDFIGLTNDLKVWFHINLQCTLFVLQNNWRHFYTLLPPLYLALPLIISLIQHISPTIKEYIKIYVVTIFQIYLKMYYKALSNWKTCHSWVKLKIFFLLWIEMQWMAIYFVILK